MTLRQRYREALLFGRPDRVPFAPGGPRESTLAAWHQQGLQPGRNYMDALLEILGIAPEKTQSQVSPGVSFIMIPTFDEKVLEHRDGHYIVQDWMGAITEISDRYDYTYIRAAKDFVTRKWHRFPVQTRADWEQMRQRYDPAAPGRFPDDFEQRCARLRERDYPVGVHFNGPFWQMREWCGFEGLCYLMADDPGFVDDMAAFWAEFVSRTLAPILERVEVDYVGISEDMAYKAHSMISPAMACRFLMPAYRRWVSQIRAAGCPIVDMDSDGMIADLIPLWIEAGINCSVPIEVAAGNDIVEYRRRFGRAMAYRGGVDKRAIAKGGDVMRAELMRVAPLIEDGGYIPGCDHGVPPDISWPHFVEYARLLAQLTGWR
ncbi:MAG TPA: uroporphyrinogen decarboxylase family protein [Armatimonadota bacterium]|nr:uroporphyrinogen decarboxylase family protein [Armatimonadota bacterium]